jgi:p90 ribosomal S6 kinase
MLHVDPYTRPSAAKVLQHPWMQQCESLSQDRLTTQDYDLVKGAMKATYMALSNKPKKENLEPVTSSMLAQRRKLKKLSSTTL